MGFRSAFPFFHQLDSLSCGPTCLRMIAKHYGNPYTLEYLSSITFQSKEGVSLFAISEAAEKIGFKSFMARMDFEHFKEHAPLPAIVHWQQKHFVVVYKIMKNMVYVADPSYGLLTLSRSEFIQGWNYSGETDSDGVVLLLEPGRTFLKDKQQSPPSKGFKFLVRYLAPHRTLLIQLFGGMLVASLIQLILPLLTQSLVDKGINHQNLDFIYLILIAQLVLYISRASVDFIRNWILLHMAVRINVSILTDFLIKLMALPISYFDSKRIGDFLQRVQDQRRIEAFLTSSVLNIIFAVFTFLTFGVVLIIYHLEIFGIFLLGSLLYIAWIMLFLKKRKDIDYRLFDEYSENNSALVQIISGMQEIKLHNCEKQKRWEWERVQAKLFQTSLRVLQLNQYQQGGSIFINELKNILITFLAAKAVVEGEITFGAMLAIQYIIGQLNGPINDSFVFIRGAQDAKLSLERLSELHGMPDEDEELETPILEVPSEKTIEIKNVDFHYSGPMSPKVLKNINLTIPEGKTTAIVGESGSGKTTLLKLLLKFYRPSIGNIEIGGVDIERIAGSQWREKCGAVMQDSFFFSDTIAKNICIREEDLDNNRLREAAELANCRQFIESLPMHYNTQIGVDGRSLSEGQKQRILIARAIYKNPDFLFFDEATNSLDTSNEKIIVKNLKNFFMGRTVVVIAHRLSTVSEADQIVVMDNGAICEKGKHNELVLKRGKYYELVRNQLELAK